MNLHQIQFEFIILKLFRVWDFRALDLVGFNE